MTDAAKGAMPAMSVGDFTHQAEMYRRARPGYPAMLIDRLVAVAGVVANDPVADFGAGTGILTEMLLERGFVVTAIEPNEAMRRYGNAPAANWVSATFERSTLADQSQRWCVAAQAFHWAQPRLALSELRRVLQPGCMLTVLWNDRMNDQDEVLSWTQEAIHRYVPDFDEAYRDRPWDEVLESTGDFAFVARHDERHRVAMSRERYLDLWRSHNRLNTLAGRDPFEQFLAELTSYLHRHAVEQVDVPYACRSWSARRVD